MNVVIAVKPKLCFCFISAQAFNGTSKSNNSLENMGVCKNAADVTTMNMYKMCITKVARIPTLSPGNTKIYYISLFDIEAPLKTEYVSISENPQLFK